MLTRTLNNRSQASDPGGVRLSHDRMGRFHPELYAPQGLYRIYHRLSPKQEFWYVRNEEHLLYGDSRAALVVATEPLLVAAYTDELDYIALLRFPSDLLAEHDLEIGTRLLTVNLYFQGNAVAKDLREGPAAHKRYCNFRPYIAEFLSDDGDRIAQRKAQIAEEEWERTLLLAAEYRSRFGDAARDGRPMNCEIPARISPWLPGQAGA